MDIILAENVFDSRLESRSDSATNLFACLAPENMSDNDIQATLNDADTNNCEQTVDKSEMLSSTEDNTVNENECIDPSSEEPVHSSTEIDPELSAVTQTNDTVNEFIPTIVDIRGACNDSSEKFDNHESLPVNSADANVTNNENENDAACIIENNVNTDVHTVSDHEELANCDKTNNIKTDVVLDPNVVIKEEPRDDDVDTDCMLIDSEDTGTCFTSEIEIKEEKTNENNDNEVRCVETTSKIPLPIPIKIEANFDNDKEESTPEPKKVQKAVKSTESGFSSADKSLADKNISKSSPTKLYSSAYRCHLCNTTFQEHELLNEHMKLHRNNSLVERYNKVYGKQRKNSKYICRTCGKRLSTGQSLSQHMMIHNNEKPHVCPICKKDFRHLSNFKMHVQKHKEEEEQRRKQREKQKVYSKMPPLPASNDRNIARSADFGRLVGPLFVKESLLKNTSSSDISRPMIMPKVEYRKPFEMKYPKVTRHDNVKENLIYYKKITTPSSTSSYDEKYSRARKFNDDIGDDVIPLKTFNNVENIVMNATKFIVKVDNLDPNLLKKKIKTPDISIDKSAASVHRLATDRKRRIQLSPSSEGAKSLKLDQIENIIMDAGDSSTASGPSLDAQTNDVDDDLDLPSYYDDDENDNDDRVVGAAEVAKTTKQETLTTNELFELLNDDRDSKDASIDQISSSPIKANTLVADELKESVSALTSVKSSPLKSSNVILLKSSPSPVRTTSQSSPRSVVEQSVPALKPESPIKNQPQNYSPPETEISPMLTTKTIDFTGDTSSKETSDKTVNLVDDSDADEDDVSIDKCDMYDNAFRNVALRRLTLIRKKAAQNGGKVENKYLLGPLFWRKAVRKAKRNQLTKEPVMSLNEAKLAYKRMNAMKYGKQDTRRTNDPAKLQQRAELKLQYILGRIKVMNDISHLNLTGPLFWKRTLKLAGIHDPNDLKRLLIDERLTISDVEFVTSKIITPSPVDVSENLTTTTTTTVATSVSISTTSINGDVTIADDDVSNTFTSNNTAAVVNLNDNSTLNVTRSTFDEFPSSLLLSPSSVEREKPPVALTGSDFLENIVVRNKTSQPITNGSHKSIVDGILNDDILKPIIDNKSIASTTPSVSRSAPLYSVQVLKTTADSTKEPTRRTVTKAESILYDSLTKPRMAIPSIAPATTTATPTTTPVTTRTNELFDNRSKKKTESYSLLGTNYSQPKPNVVLSSAPLRRNITATTTSTSSELFNRSLLTSSTSWANNTTKKTPCRVTTAAHDTKISVPISNRLAPSLVAPISSLSSSAAAVDNRVIPLITSSTTAPAPEVHTSGATAVAVVTDSVAHQQIEVPDSTTALEAGGNIILNVDSADFQLIADSKNENGQETNYVLVSDGNGGVQLIKENDFRLLEDAGATSTAPNASHYIVNVPGEENFANFDLMANATAANGEQLAYIQLDGENYTALQFIQDAGVALEDSINGTAVAVADKQKILTAGEKNVNIAGTNYVIAADPSSDLNHIGKELSDFLHIDYGTLLKNDNHHQQT